ncbi:MAG: ABC transporter ATP-binding protein [Clostridia bacterium]|jgi:ATP-binding cassette subfamily B protein|nr:ABC transporter ATP-binding protein [Clostridiaceae bacterium]
MMKAGDLLPKYLDNELKALELDREDVLFAAPSDLDYSGLFSENWLIITKEKLYILQGTSFSRKKKGKSAEEESTFNLKEVKEYPIGDIKSILINDMVSGGVLIAEMEDGTDVYLCRFTATRQKDFGILARIHSKLKNNEEIRLHEIMQEQTKNVCPKCGRYYPDPGRKVCPHCIDKRSIFIRILSYMKNYKLRAALLIVFMLLSATANIFRPYVNGNILFDEALAADGRYYGKIGQVILLIAAAQLIFLIFSIIQGRINAFLATNVVYDIKVNVFRAMQELSMRFFSSKETGSLLTRVNNDSSRLTYFFHDGMPYVVVNAFVMVGTLAVLFSMNVKLTFLILLPVPLVLYISKVIFPTLNTLHTKRYRTVRYLNALVNDTLTGFRVVKAFGKEKNEIDRFVRANGRFTDSVINISTYASTAFPLMHLLISTGSLIVWGYGGYQVIQGNLSFGSLVAFNMYLGMLYQPIQYMSDLVNWWSDTMTAGQRIFEIIDAVPDIYEIQNAYPMDKAKGHIELKNVSFSYEPNKPVIHNISLEIRPGETIGIVGKSGAGKSTLANLITRLYDVDEGQILIDGINIKEYKLDDLHSKIGMVMQDTFLFSGTIAENISYGRPDAHPEDIIQASIAAGAHDFIMKLPDKYDTLIGKEGQDLSGGERQRVSIARTILHNPDVLILDEATASVDTETEIKIQSALDRLIKNKTTLVIAHRLSTLRSADRILVIDNGRIVEIGTHDELIEKKGEFYNIMETQKKALEIGGVIQ